jgi:two-component sensor histidine kinase
MALHELASNAVKHGALSAKAGRIDIAWRVEPASGRFQLDWRERGGPPVRAPTRAGFGVRVIEASFRDQLDGRVDIAFDPSGLRCAIDAPLAALQEAAANNGNARD